MRPDDFHSFLSKTQVEQLERWLPGAQLEADLSWHEMDTVVLLTKKEGQRYILKSAGEQNHHFDRELQSHQNNTAGLIAAGYCASLIAASVPQRLMLLEYLPGTLIDRTAAAFDPDIHHQAGRALKILHHSDAHVDQDYETQLIAKCQRVLSRPHRIPTSVEQEVLARLSSYHPQPVQLVPTHGDWQPRNWLNDHGRLRIIDFGRFEYRPAATDLVRLAAQQWSGRPDLEEAFFAGYGKDPRSQLAWPMLYLHEAIGTAVWAYQMGAEEFEEQGHRMLVEALRLFNS